MIRAVMLLALTTILLLVTDGSCQIIGLTPYNIKKAMGCKREPIKCNHNEDWVLLFYNSNNSRQLSTFEYLVPGFAKELIFSREWHSDKSVFEYPPTAVIDCYTCPSLCQQIGAQDLPLVLHIDSESREFIRYQGYVSLSGLISFIKTHDPKTSYLAEVYSRGVQYFQHKDASQKQMNRVIESLDRNVREQIEARKRELTFEQRMAQNQAKNIKQQQEQQKLVKQQQQAQVHESSEKTKQAEQQIEVGINDNQQPDKIQIEPTVANEQNKQKKSQKSKKQKKNSKKQKTSAKVSDSSKQSGKVKANKEEKKKQSGFEQFISVVESSSKGMADVFASIGLGGFLLGIIEWIFYIFFFVLFGSLCIILQAIG